VVDKAFERRNYYNDMFGSTSEYIDYQLSDGGDELSRIEDDFGWQMKPLPTPTKFGTKQKYKLTENGEHMYSQKIEKRIKEYWGKTVDREVRKAKYVNLKTDEEKVEYLKKLKTSFGDVNSDIAKKDNKIRGYYRSVSDLERTFFLQMSTNRAWSTKIRDED
jgi:hypothetical protein